MTSSIHFNPRPSYEGRRGLWTRAMDGCEFQSTPLIRGATLAINEAVSCMEFQSTPLIRGATERGLRRDAGGRISIHAPHTRGDAARGWLTMTSSISIHAPHTRGDWSRWSASPAPQYFNPRPSYEGRRHHLAHRDCDRRISIHAPHTRGDTSTPSTETLR